jgi:hypothetical protein
MNSDATYSLVRQVLTGILTSSTAAAYLSGDQAVAVAGAIATLANVGWSIYSHHGMVKVPQEDAARIPAK